MLAENLWPVVSALLHARYLESRRAYLAEHPELPQWKKKKRRGGRHRPIPGVYDAPHEVEG